MPITSHLYKLEEAQWKLVAKGSAETKDMSHHAEREAYKEGLKPQHDNLLFIQNGFPCQSVNNRTNATQACYDWFKAISANRFVFVHVTEDHGEYSSGYDPRPTTPVTIYFHNGEDHAVVPAVIRAGALFPFQAVLANLPEPKEKEKGKSAFERKFEGKRR